MYKLPQLLGNIFTYVRSGVLSGRGVTVLK
jgi:hypothetical protein